MAAPPEINIRNLSGKYTMSKALSDNQDAFFTLQGFGWVMRKGMQMATITLVVKQYEKDGFVHTDIGSNASGLKSTQEDRVCNWEERKHKDNVFGNVVGKSRFVKRAEFQSALDNVTEDEKKYLLGERLADGSESAFLDDEFLQSVAVNQDGLGWAVDQLWGFEQVNGERRYTRRLLCKNKGKACMMRLVYDYNGPLDG